MVLRLPANEIGGAIVRRGFSWGARRMIAGTLLTADDVLAMRNRLSLEDKGFIQCYPKSPATAPTDIPKTSLIVVNKGFGKYDVVRGFVLNEHPLSKAEAAALVVAEGGEAEAEAEAVA